MLRSELISQVSNDIKNLRKSLEVATNLSERRGLQLGIKELEEYYLELREEENSEAY